MLMGTILSRIWSYSFFFIYTNTYYFTITLLILFWTYISVLISNIIITELRLRSLYFKSFLSRVIFCFGRGWGSWIIMGFWRFDLSGRRKIVLLTGCWRRGSHVVIFRFCSISGAIDCNWLRRMGIAVFMMIKVLLLFGTA